MTCVLSYFTDITISDPLFEGSIAFMSFERSMNLRFETEVIMEFKPRSDTGLLFYVASQLTPYAGDFLAISLAQGYVELRYSLGKFICHKNTLSCCEAWHCLEGGK